LIKNYIKAARLRTLPLSISGIIVGASLAKSFGVFNAYIFILAIINTIGFQILSNFANDYGDGIKGTDRNRQGEARMVASGEITPRQMKSAMIITIILTLVCALLLVYLAFGIENIGYSLLFILLGIASIIAAIKYTVGKFAYGYSGFGDIFVFFFFGILSVVGSFFLFTKKIYFFVFFPAFSIGLLSTAVLNLNNMRDIKNDEISGKYTLVVKIGSEFAKYYHYYLIGASLLFAMLYTVINYKSPYQFLFLLAYIPLVKHMFFVFKNINEEELDGELKKVSLSTFLFSILFGIGQVL